MAGDGDGDPAASDLERVVREALSLEGEIGLRRTPTGKFNDTFFVACGGDEFVLRMAPEEDRGRMLFYEHRMMLQEPAIHRRLREETAMPVPEILHFEERNAVLGRDFLVMEKMRGEPLGSFGTADGVYRELGARLREVHETVRAEAGRYGYLGEHRPMEPQAAWGDAFAMMWELLIADIENCGGYDSGEADGWRRLFETHRGVFFHYEAPASLLHMDVWAENILADAAGRLTALVDWDRALWGDPEIEFAVLDYCGISTPEFWRGYGCERPRGREAEIRRVFYLLYEVQKYIVIRMARQGNPAGAERYKSMARELAEGLER